MTLQRPLDPIESQLADYPEAFTLRYEGEIHYESLARAFTVLCQRHPVLHSRVVFDDRLGWLCVPSDESVRVLVIDSDDFDNVADVCVAWDVSRNACRLALLRGKCRGVVALHIDHAIVDGTAGYAFWTELWDLYVQIENGDTPPGKWSNPKLPTAPSRLLERCTGEISTDARNELRRYLQRAQPNMVAPPGTMPQPALEFMRARIRFSAEETAGIVSAARQHMTTMQGLLSAAVLLSQRSVIDSTPGKLQMACVVVVDLRHRSNPPVGPTETTTFAGEQRGVQEISPGMDLVTVARTVTELLKEGLRRGEVVEDLIGRLRPVPRNTDDHPSPLTDAIVSNLGVLRPVAQPRDATVSDFDLYPHRVGKPYPTYAAWTYAGELTVLVVFRKGICSPVTMDTIVHNVEAHIRSVL